MSIPDDFEKVIEPDLHDKINDILFGIIFHIAAIYLLILYYKLYFLIIFALLINVSISYLLLTRGHHLTFSKFYFWSDKVYFPPFYEDSSPKTGKSIILFNEIKEMYKTKGSLADFIYLITEDNKRWRFRALLQDRYMIRVQKELSFRLGDKWDIIWKGVKYE